MTLHNDFFTRTLKAGQDLRTLQYRVVRTTAAGACFLSSNRAAGAHVQGILVNKPNSGEAATVAWLGEVKALGGAAVTANRLVTTNGSGKVVNASSGDWAFGVAVRGTGADAEYARILLQTPRYLPNSLAAALNVT